MAKRKPVLVELDNSLLTSLDAFCEAHYGAPRSRIIREAIEFFITEKLRSESGLSDRFDDAIRDKSANLKDKIRVLEGRSKN